MGETIKDKHRLPIHPPAAADEEAAKAQLGVIVARETPAVHPVPPPECPHWVPWAQPRH